MGRPGISAMALGVVLTLLSGCGAGNGCTKIGGSNNLRIQIPAALQKVAPTIRVELCQGQGDDQRCGSLNFETKPSQPDGVLATGISRDAEGNYDVDLDLLGQRWKPGTPSGLTVLGFTRKGRTVLRHDEQITFAGYYPNGKDCDPEPFVRYGTSLGGADLVG